MSKVRITKQFTFETGHALYGHDGKCKNIHGHSYKLSVTIFGKPLEDSKSSKFGMIMDFSDLKKIVKEEIVNPLDHATIFNKNTPHLQLANNLKSIDHKVVLVDFSAQWCGPCKVLAPILKEVKNEVGDTVKIIKIDVDKNQPLSAMYKVMGVPTLILFVDGKQVWRQSGVMQKQELLSMLQAKIS